MSHPEVYVSVDVEADGPIPGPYSMLSLGAVALEYAGLGEWEKTQSFSVNFTRLRFARQHPDTMKFWAEHPQAYAATLVDPKHPLVAMQAFRQWLEVLPGKPVFVGYPASYDFMFVYWYFQKFLGQCPFGFAALDVKTLAWALLGGNFRDVSKRRMPKDWFNGAPKHDHTALADAQGQAVLFERMIEHLRATRGALHGTRNEAKDVRG